MADINKFNLNNFTNNKYIINMGTSSSLLNNNQHPVNNSNDKEVNNYVKYSTNPNVLGPGVWYDIHLESKNAKIEEQKKAFVHKMYLLAQSFPCLTCRKHIDEYLQNNPFEPFWNEITNTGEQIGMFKWSWYFHNSVNQRLNKPLVSWDNALYIFSDASINSCDKDCTDEKITSSPVHSQLIYPIQLQPTPQLSIQPLPQTQFQYRSPVYSNKLSNLNSNSKHNSSKHKTSKSKHKYVSPQLVYRNNIMPLYVKNSSYNDDVDDNSVIYSPRNKYNVS